MKTAVVTGWVGLIAVCVLSGGCRTLSYDCTDLRPTEQDARRSAMRVAVLPFQDTRPESERIREVVFRMGPPPDLETCDADFRGGGIGRGIAKALVIHFNHVGLFGHTSFVETSNGSPTNDLGTLRGAGHDAVFTGTVSHFEGIGHFSRSDKAFFSSGGSILSIFMIPFMYREQNMNEGNADLVDLKLTDTTTGTVLWSGASSNSVVEFSQHADPVTPACSALKQAVANIVRYIEAADTRGW